MQNLGSARAPRRVAKSLLPPGGFQYRLRSRVARKPMRSVLVANSISRRNSASAPIKLSIAKMNSIAITSPNRKSSRAPRNSVTTTRDTSNAQTVHNAMAAPSSRERSSSVSSRWLSSPSSLSCVLLSACSSARARSTTRASRLVMSVSVMPTPDSRNTGATAIRTTSPTSVICEVTPRAMPRTPLACPSILAAPLEAIERLDLAARELDQTFGTNLLLDQRESVPMQFKALFDQQALGARRRMARIGLAVRFIIARDFIARDLIAPGLIAPDLAPEQLTTAQLPQILGHQRLQQLGRIRHIEPALRLLEQIDALLNVGHLGTHLLRATQYPDALREHALRIIG